MGYYVVCIRGGDYLADIKSPEVVTNDVDLARKFKDQDSAREYIEKFCKGCFDIFFRRENKQVWVETVLVGN